MYWILGLSIWAVAVAGFLALLCASGKARREAGDVDPEPVEVDEVLWHLSHDERGL